MVSAHFSGVFLGLFGLGGQEAILIGIAVLFFFGGAKIPELAKGLGKGIKEFKDAVNSDPEKDKTLADKNPEKKD